jgi:hypothetical protein
MTDQVQMFAYLAPMVGIMGLFWHVARKLGEVETDLKQLREENARLRSDLVSLQTLLSVLVDARR